MKNIISLLLISVIISSCAGSAQHQVVSANRAGDANLDCKGLDAEIVRAQVIIDGVNQEKQRISRADYKNATQAAYRRICVLQGYKSKKGCDSNNQEIKAKSASIVQELNDLNAMYKAGDNTKDEFEAAKRELLEN